MSALPSLTRLAWALAVRGGQATRWRMLLVPLASGLALAVAMSGASILHLARQLTERETEAHGGKLVSSPDEADLLMLPSSYEIAGKEAFLAWVEPGRGQELRLPGVRQPLGPGMAAVSPALAALLRTTTNNPLSAHVTIADNGIREPDELVAYVRPAREGVIREAPTALRYALDGRPKVSLFPASRTEFRGGRDMYAAVGLFSAIPCLLLCWIAATAGSARRQRRMVTLAWLGAPRRMAGLLAASETMILAAPGLVAGSVVYLMLASRLTTVPIVSRPTFRGDLDAGVPTTLGCALGLLALLAASSAIAGWCGANKLGGPRPAPRTQRWHPLRLAGRVVVLALAAVALALSLVIPPTSSVAVTAVAVGALAILVAIPPACGAVVALLARFVARIDGPLWLLCGRQLARVGTRDVRPFAVAGVMLAAIVALTGLYARTSDPIVQGSRPPQVAMLRWSDPRPGDAIRLEAVLPNATVVNARARTPYGYQLDASCSRLSRRLASIDCTRDGSSTVASLLGLPPDGLSFREEAIPRPTALLLVWAKPDRQMPESIYAASLEAGFVRPLVDTSTWRPPSLPAMVRWLLLGALVSGLATFLALVIAQVDTVAAQTDEGRTLERLGLTRARLARMVTLRHLLLAGCCNAVGLAVGLAIAFTLTNGSDHNFQPAWTGYGIELTLAAVFTLLGGALAQVAARQGAAGPERPG